MSRTPPVIGLTCYVEDVDRAPWVGQRSAVLPYRYVEQVQRAGGLAVVLPPRHDVDEQMAARLLDRVDGLVVGGGADVDARRYGEDPHPSSQDPRHDRDAWEIALVHAATGLDLPVLGICRGAQLISVYFGGTLTQHLEGRLGTNMHRSFGPRDGIVHNVTATSGRLRDLLGDAPVEVNSIHRQGIDRLGDGLTATAHAEDGLVEGFEAAGRNIVAVQWHPEEMYADRAAPERGLFSALVAAATASERTLARSPY